MPPEDSCVPASDVQITKQPFSLYLFYDHSYDYSDYRKSLWCYCLYKFVVNLNEPTTYSDDNPSPILVDFPADDNVVGDTSLIPEREYIPIKGKRWAPNPILVFPKRNLWAPRGMRCARLGSKLYFLGGTVKDSVDRYPQDVFVFDMVTEEIKLMDVRLQAGKPDPCAVFAANGKVYALGCIPPISCLTPLARLEFLSTMKLFECYDPTTNRWEVLNNLPPANRVNYCGRPNIYKGINWVGCNVLEKRQQVVLIGMLTPPSDADEEQVKLVYHIREDKWTCRRLGGEDAWATLTFQEAADDNEYLYGLPRQIAHPLKSKSDYVSSEDEIALFWENGKAAWFPEEEAPPPPVGVVKMSSPDMSKQELYTLFASTLWPYTYYSLTRLLRYAGHSYFCYLNTGNIDHNIFPGEDVEVDYDCSRGITITLLKEEIEHGNQHSFLAQILHSQIYVIRTPFVNCGELEGCFVVTPEQLQRRLNRKEKKKKKNQNVQ